MIRGEDGIVDAAVLSKRKHVLAGTFQRDEKHIFYGRLVCFHGTRERLEETFFQIR